MHSPTLIILAAVLATLITTVMYAVWYFNKSIPGLRLWMFSFLCTAVFTISLLVRERMPEVVAVVLAQGLIATASYLCLLASRRYVGKPLGSRVLAVAAIVVLTAASAYFTLLQPSVGARFALMSLGSGIFFLLTARTLAVGGMRQVPARYLFAGVAGVHGLFLLLRPVLFKVGKATAMGENPVRMLELLSQFVVLESIVALVLLAFGALILANEFITTELRHLAEVDPLTNVFNRRAFLTLLDKAISHAQRTQTALPVLLIDLDHFKKINDTWGHGAGDEVLRHFVAQAGRCLRKEDVMGRLGGEEFAIFLPNAGGGSAIAVAERLRALVEGQPMATDQRAIALSVSVGVTLSHGGESASAALQRADEAMYLAKKRGRNRVEMLAQAQTAAVAV